MVVDPMQMQQAYAMQQGGYDPYGGQLNPQGWGSFFRRALPVAVNVARQFIPADATQQMLAAQYGQQQQFAPQQFAPQGWLGDLAGQYGGAVGGAVGGWLGNKHLGTQIGGTLGNIAQRYSPYDATQQMLAAQYGQQIDPQSLAAGYDPYGGQLDPQGWGSFFRRALPVAVDVARQFIPQDATQQMLAAQYGQQQQFAPQQLDPQMLAAQYGQQQYAPQQFDPQSLAAGYDPYGGQLNPQGWGSFFRRALPVAVNVARQFIPADATQQMLAAQYGQQQQFAPQQLDPQGWWGNQITKYAQPVGSIVGGIAGNQQLGSQIGAAVGGLGQYLPFDATQQMLAAQQQQLAPQQYAQQQYAQQLDPQGFFGSLAGKVLGGVGGRVVGGWLGNKHLGQQIGSIAGGIGGSFLPFQAGPMPQGYGPGYGYGNGY